MQLFFYSKLMICRDLLKPNEIKYQAIVLKNPIFECAQYPLKATKSIDYAAKMGNLPAVQNLFLMGENANGATLYSAISNHREEIATALIKAGTKVASDPITGYSPITYAAYKNNATLVRILLESGASANPDKKNDWSPLKYAAWHNNLELVRLLVKAGAVLKPEEDCDICSSFF